jgi:hypothetical protein
MVYRGESVVVLNTAEDRAGDELPLLRWRLPQFRVWVRDAVNRLCTSLRVFAECAHAARVTIYRRSESRSSMSMRSLPAFSAAFMSSARPSGATDIP